MVKEKVEVVKYSATGVVRHAQSETIKLPKIIKLVYFIADVCKRVKYSKKNVLIRDNYECGYCGKHSKKLTIDHVFPKSRGGKSTFTNTVAACMPCNSKKENKTPHESGMKLRKRLFEPAMSQIIEYKIDSGILKEISRIIKNL